MQAAVNRNQVARLGVGAAVALGLLWFTTQFPHGAYLHGAAYRLYASYANDLLQPFGLYFALCALDSFLPALRPWPRKAGLAFLIPLGMELLQMGQRYGWGFDPSTAYFFGLGTVFDPLDVPAYALGVAGAAWADLRLLPRPD